MECFRQLFDNLAWIEHQFLSGIRDSRKAGRLWGMMRDVGGVRKSIHQCWLAKELGLLCWGFKGVQEEIPSEEASTLQIGSVTFPLGQCTSPQLHPCYSLFDQDGHQDSSSLPYSRDLAPCDFWLFPKLRGCRRYETIEVMKEAVTKVIDKLTQEDFDGAFQKLLLRYNKCWRRIYNSSLRIKYVVETTYREWWLIETNSKRNHGKSMQAAWLDGIYM